MRIFITGATGFAGSHLVEQLLPAGHDIIALYHPASSKQQLPNNKQISRVAGDLLDVESLQTAIKTAQPDAIYHLAGQAYPGRSWQIPGQTLMVNAAGTANLLHAATAYGQPRVVIVTSADIYGHIQPANCPVTETTIARPRHPYGVSKLAAGQLATLFWERFGLPVIEARPFNHIGPRQALGFVVPDFASQIAAIKQGTRPATIAVGNLAAERDFTDVRDVVRAYILLAENGRPGKPYLICSGKPVSIQSILDELIDLSGLDIAIRPDPQRMRPADIPLFYGSHARLLADTGWEPSVSLTQSLRDVYQEWLDHETRMH